jgi:hypothetical protein
LVTIFFLPDVYQQKSLFRNFKAKTGRDEPFLTHSFKMSMEGWTSLNEFDKK